MTELAGLAWLLGGLAALVGAAVLVAACLRLRSALDFALAVYVLAWAWVVVAVLVLSPWALVTRTALLAAIGVGLVGAGAAWLSAGRPGPPSVRPALRELRAALRRPSLLVLAIAVGCGLAYTVALAFIVPANDGDALAYHVARAAFWRQEHGVGYVANAVDLRLDVNPPNGEIGQLVTMLLSGGDRYVALPQLAAYVACILCVGRLGREVGLATPDAVFGALAFATLPIVALQAPAALNDLIVASFLTIAAVFALRQGRAFLVLFALAVALAVGTKFTALFALPALAFVVALARPLRALLPLAVAGTVGVAFGSTWLLVNAAETGAIDGGLGESGNQRLEASASAVLTNSMQFALDVVDMSGARSPHGNVFLLAAAALGVLAATRVRTSPTQTVALTVAGIATAAVVLAGRVEDLGQRTLDKAWAVLGRRGPDELEGYIGLNVAADPVESWYGPLGALFLVVGSVWVTVLWLRGRVHALPLALALAPWVLLLTFATTIVWDPFRGRFLIFGVALAAGAWGVLSRHPVVAPGTAAIGTTALALSLLNYQGKPSGLGDLWPVEEIRFVTTETIWGADRPSVLARLRPDEGEEGLYRYLDRNVPPAAALAIAPRENDFLSPFFGPRLSRHVSLASRLDAVAESADWLVLAPAADARRCRASWRRTATFPSGWRVERRIAPDDGC